MYCKFNIIQMDSTINTIQAGSMRRGVGESDRERDKTYLSLTFSYGSGILVTFKLCVFNNINQLSKIHTT